MDLVSYNSVLGGRVMHFVRCKGAEGVNSCAADYVIAGDASGAYCAEHIVRLRNKGKNVRIVKTVNS